MDYKAIMDDPVLAGIAMAILATVGSGLALIWKALTKCIVRALDKLAPEHTGTEVELVAKVRKHEGRGKVEALMLTMVAPILDHARRKRLPESQERPQSRKWRRERGLT